MMHQYQIIPEKELKTACGGKIKDPERFPGALTVLIPCGVTQAMMAVALATGNPLQGAVQR